MKFCYFSRVFGVISDTKKCRWKCPDTRDSLFRNAVTVSGTAQLKCLAKFQKYRDNKNSTNIFHFRSWKKFNVTMHEWCKATLENMFTKDGRKPGPATSSRWSTVHSSALGFGRLAPNICFLILFPPPPFLKFLSPYPNQSHNPLFVPRSPILKF